MKTQTLAPLMLLLLATTLPFSVMAATPSADGEDSMALRQTAPINLISENQATVSPVSTEAEEPAPVAEASEDLPSLKLNLLNFHEEPTTIGPYGLGNPVPEFVKSPATVGEAPVSAPVLPKVAPIAPSGIH